MCDNEHCKQQPDCTCDPCECTSGEVEKQCDCE